MGKRVEKHTTKAHIVNAPLPQQTLTYTVIPHVNVIDKTFTSLNAHGFEVEQELYRATQNAEVAQGIYYLKHSQDPEMGLMFAWSNSYDKSMSFRCSIGGHIYLSGSRIIPAMGAYRRVHTGNADVETNNQINDQLANAGRFFAQLVQDKDNMKLIHVPLRRAAEILGILFIEKRLISSEQLNLIKSELKMPSFDYKVDKESLWVLYNHIILALQKSHPRTWMDQQRLCHWFICEEFQLDNFIAPVQEEVKVQNQHVVNPNQTSLLDQPGVMEEVNDEKATT